MTPLARITPLLLLAALPAVPAARAADDLPTPPKAGTIVTAGQEKTAIAAARSRSTNNLKQIALSFHNHHDVNQSMPSGIYGPGGKVGLSWRVQILPYIEETPLYKEFKLDEPWDSDHNKKLIGRMPKLFAPPKGAEVANGLTYYRAFSGPGTVIPPAPPNGKAGQPVPGIRITAITDGTSNTFLVAEAADPVVWTKPDELAYDPAKPTPKLGGLFEAGFNVAMCDGSVRFLPKNTDDKIIRALITANGGEVVRIP
jgi:hypothetical protein